MRGSRGVIGVLAAAGFLFGVAALALVLTNDHEEITGPFVVLALTLGWSFIATGLYALWRRPEQPIGWLMTLVGFLWFLGALPESDSAVIYTAGLALGGLWAGPLVHLLIAFPTGQVAPGLERNVVRLGYTLPLVQMLVLPVLPDSARDCSRCPENLLLVSAQPGLSDALMIALGAAAVAMLAGVGVVLVRRWRASGPVQRRALAPVIWTGAAIVVIGVLGVIPDAVGADAVTAVMNSLLIAAITALPFAFLIGLLRSSLSRAAAVSALVERVGATTVRDALAEALGDRALWLAFWLPRLGGYVDPDGHPVALPAPGGPRAVTEIEHDGIRVAAIVHDAALLEEPELVRAAGAAAGLALVNERLDAELRAHYEELRASRTRIVAAGDAARRKIERDLHDGAQQHLVSLALTLRLARSSAAPDSKTAILLDAAIDELKHGLSELRELARGIHPAVLTERGLEAALAGLAVRAPVPVTVTGTLEERLPPELESAAYFLVCEALTNVAKYASATEAEVSLRLEAGHVVIEVRDDGCGGADARNGSGLSGIADRVAALDGVLVVQSPRGAGTLVRAELPHRVPVAAL
ncbi:histidine kinase [Solirubrobacter ginsenosidimutans]|uniref:histidine kinase n=1 Tax=Solirubrobacter ginsenosidimutans TaxID=490573 RepID=A0A9X3MTU5_9ACTN|nr:histidine kinase [Solirubrobacter ginsenosidimutans]MDA0161756.1 histidine kinase [Solirubrobacter ginsenosidimutans]